MDAPHAALLHPASRSDLAVGHGRWTEALDDALATVDSEFDTLTDRSSACARVQRALLVAHDAHLMSACAGQGGWRPGTPGLHPQLVEQMSTTPLPIPARVQPEVAYVVQRLAPDGNTRRASIVFTEGRLDRSQTTSPWRFETLGPDDALPATAVHGVSHLCER